MEVKCKNCDQPFKIDKIDGDFYAKMQVPPPSFCPNCRQQRRLAWRNESTLYKRKCDATGADIISVFHEGQPFPVYDNEYWYSDQWDPFQYGRDFDFTRPFFPQFQELMHSVPQLARSAVNNQNSDYVNQCGWCKNCYLVYEADFDENCMYSVNIYDSRFTLDCLTVTNCELCYECIDCEDSYNLKYSQDCQNCSDSWFLKSCIGCRDCYGCVNLRNKQYYFLNHPYQKDEYEAKIKALNLNTAEALGKARKNFAEFIKQYPQKYLQGTQNEDSTGNYIFNTQRCRNCYDLNNSQDCRYVFNCRNMKQCYDITAFGSKRGAEFCYECHEIGYSSLNILFSDQVWTGCADIAYSKLCILNCKNLFGCVSLKKQEYCIFNKKYSPEDYTKLRAKIIKHMKETGEYGEFFPSSMSPFGYNETVAQYYYPLEPNTKGFNWYNKDDEMPDIESEKISKCQNCAKPFKIIQSEVAFYQRQNLPQSDKCPDCRHYTRFKLRNPRPLYDRHCDKCAAVFKTTYALDRKEKIYCETCYLQSLT